jgi:hypothetical protein
VEGAERACSQGTPLRDRGRAGGGVPRYARVLDRAPAPVHLADTAPAPAFACTRRLRGRPNSPQPLNSAIKPVSPAHASRHQRPTTHSTRARAKMLGRRRRRVRRPDSLQLWRRAAPPFPSDAVPPALHPGALRSTAQSYRASIALPDDAPARTDRPQDLTVPRRTGAASQPASLSRRPPRPAAARCWAPRAESLRWMMAVSGQSGGDPCGHADSALVDWLTAKFTYEASDRAPTWQPSRAPDSPREKPDARSRRSPAGGRWSRRTTLRCTRRTASGPLPEKLCGEALPLSHAVELLRHVREPLLKLQHLRL